MPLLELFFNLNAGPAGFNLVAVMTYAGIVALILCAAIERN